KPPKCRHCPWPPARSHPRARSDRGWCPCRPAPPSNPYRREPIGGWRVSDFLSSRRARLDVAVDHESRAEVALASQAKGAVRHGRTWRRCVPALIARHWDLDGEPVRDPDLAQLGARKPLEAGKVAAENRAVAEMERGECDGDAGEHRARPAAASFVPARDEEHAFRSEHPRQRPREARLRGGHEHEYEPGDGRDE